MSFFIVLIIGLPALSKVGLLWRVKNTINYLILSISFPLNIHSLHLLLSLHNLHICSGSIDFKYSSITICMVLVMGSLRAQAIRLSVELSLRDSAGVYAIVSPPFCGLVYV